VQHITNTIFIVASLKLSFDKLKLLFGSLCRLPQDGLQSKYSGKGIMIHK
jgi:hypothetical protein